MIITGKILDTTQRYHTGADNSSSSLLFLYYTVYMGVDDYYFFGLGLPGFK